MARAKKCAQDLFAIEEAIVHAVIIKGAQKTDVVILADACEFDAVFIFK